MISYLLSLFISPSISLFTHTLTEGTSSRRRRRRRSSSSSSSSSGECSVRFLFFFLDCLQLCGAHLKETMWTPMYTCIDSHICIPYMYLNICTYTHTHTHTYIHIYVSVYIYIYITYVCLHAYTHSYNGTLYFRKRALYICKRALHYSRARTIESQHSCPCRSTKT